MCCFRQLMILLRLVGNGWRAGQVGSFGGIFEGATFTRLYGIGENVATLLPIYINVAKAGRRPCGVRFQGERLADGTGRGT